MNTHSFKKVEKVKRGRKGMCRMLFLKFILCISLFLPLLAGAAVSAAPDPSAITLDGYLLTSCCYFGTTGSPASHGRGCLNMTGCAHTGYGISVLNNQGEYDFYFFDGEFYPAAAGDPAAAGGQALARTIVETSIKTNHIAVQVSGTLTGATRIQTYHDGTLGAKYPEISVSSLQEASGITPVPGELTGYIIDEDCFTGNTDPGSDSIMCLRMAGCAASGYGIAVLQADGTYTFAYFDGTFKTTAGVLPTEGQLLADNLLAGTLTENHVTVHAAGQYNGEKIKKAANNTIYPVFAVFELSEVIAPTATPAADPTITPTTIPTNVPTTIPTSMPTAAPSVVPTSMSTLVPTDSPESTIPHHTPTPATSVAAAAVTASPTISQTVSPTSVPSADILGLSKTGEKDSQIPAITGIFLLAASVWTGAHVINRRNKADKR